MSSEDEIRALRRRHDDLKNSIPDQPVYVGDNPTVLALTTTLQTYPTDAQCFFACQILSLLGAESEGGSGIVVPGSGTFFALNLGSTIPPSGTQVLASFVGNRWVFRYDSYDS